MQILSKIYQIVYHQCDQVTTLSFQYWAINNNEKLYNIIKNCPICLQKFAQYKISPKRIAKNF